MPDARELPGQPVEMIDSAATGSPSESSRKPSTRWWCIAYVRSPIVSAIVRPRPARSRESVLVALDAPPRALADAARRRGSGRLRRPARRSPETRRRTLGRFELARTALQQRQAAADIRDAGLVAGRRSHVRTNGSGAARAPRRAHRLQTAAPAPRHVVGLRSGSGSRRSPSGAMASRSVARPPPACIIASRSPTVASVKIRRSSSVSSSSSPAPRAAKRSASSHASVDLVADRRAGAGTRCATRGRRRTPRTPRRPG